METVKVAIPAAPRYVQVVRLIAAGLASRLGFTLDEIEEAYPLFSNQEDGVIKVTVSP